MLDSIPILLSHRAARASGESYAIRQGKGLFGGALIAIILYACGPALHAQAPEFPDSLSHQTLVARTERFSATHTTSLYEDYNVERGIFNGIVRNFLRTSTTLLSEPATRDQIDTYIDMNYALPASMNLFMLLEGTLSNDVKRGGVPIPGLNNTAASFVGIGGRVRDEAGNRVGLAVGGSYNRQLNAEDAGAAVYGEILGRESLGGYNLQLDGKGHWYNISPRHNSNAYLDAQIERHFDNASYGDLHARYEMVNTDLYIKRSEDAIAQYGGLTYDGLQDRNEQRISINSLLGYAAADELAFDANLSLGSIVIAQQEVTEGLPPLPRSADPFHYAREDFSIGANIGARWTPPRSELSVRLDYSNNEERNTVDRVAGIPETAVSPAELKRKRLTARQSDFVSQQLTLSGSALYRLTRYDTLSASGSVGIYRYDTPDTANKFDRDEQTLRAQIRYGRMFNPRLSFAIYGQIFLTHLVYLFGENSNDNNWNRVFRLSPSVRYDLGRSFQTNLEAEVLANYTQYDFEGRTQTIRGRSFRQMRLRDSTALAITGTLVLAVQGDLQIFERGSFDWIKFAESPLERTRIEGAEAALTTTAVSGIEFSAGGRLSRAKTYTAPVGGGEMLPATDRTSFGPTARIRLRLSELSDVQFYGWWEHRSENSELVDRVPTLFLTVGVKL